MARRALIIGLGTTGTTVCDHLIERLEWENGSLSRTPWIDFLSIETADVAGQPVDRAGAVVRLHVHKNEKLFNVLSNPGHWEAQLEPLKWTDSSLRTLLSSIAGPGAGNIRQAGRLAFLFPEHFRQVISAIQSRLERVATLPVQNAQYCFEGDPDDLNFPPRQRHPAEPDFSLLDGVTIYVVGSLCGGTSSGCFIDLAYALRNVVPAYRTAGPSGCAAHVAGIFAGYPRDGMHDGHGANTYWAVREYNHWATPGVTYEALLDGQRVRDHRIPFDEFHLLAPTTARSEHVDQACAAIADYLYVRNFCSDDAAVDGARSNFANGYTSLARNGTHQIYATFGVSGIEFPARRLTEACQLTLAKEALDHWLDPENGGDQRQPGLQSRVQQDLAQLGILGDRLLSRLLSSASGEEGVLDRLRAHLEGRGLNSEGDLAALQECETQVEIALGSATPGVVSADPKLPYGCVRESVTANRETIALELRESLTRALRTAFLKPDQGPAYCYAYLRHAEQFVSMEMKRHAPDPQTGRTGVQVEAETVREQKEAIQRELEAAHEDTFLKFLLNKRFAIDRLCGEWVDTAQDYYQLRVADVQRGALLEILQEIFEALCRYRERVEPDAFARTYLDVAHSTLARDLDQNLRHPHITNYEVVCPVNRENVTARFKDAFSEHHDTSEGWRKRAAAAEEDLLQAFAPLAEAVFSTRETPETITRLLPNSSAVPDRARINLRLEDRKALMDRSRLHFRKIENTHILKLLEQEAGNAEAKRLVDAMLRKSQPMLAINYGDAPRWEQLPRKHAGFVFFNGQRQTQGHVATIQPDVQSFARHLTSPPADGSGIVNTEVLTAESVEWHRVTAIREQTAFPLAAVDGFLSGGAYENYWRRDQTSLVHVSRSDIANWYPVEPDPETEQIIRRLLVLISIGAIDVTRPQLVFQVSPQGETEVFPRSIQAARVQYAGASRRRDILVAAMQNRIHQYRQQHGDDELVIQISTFIARASECGLFQEDGRPLDSATARNWLIPYLRSDSQLWARWKSMGNTPPSLDPALLFVRQGQEIPGARRDAFGAGPSAQQDGYYCDGCGFRFGADPGDVIRAGRCIGCGKAFVLE